MPGTWDVQEIAPGCVGAPKTPVIAPQELTIWDFKENGIKHSCCTRKASLWMETRASEGPPGPLNAIRPWNSSASLLPGEANQVPSEYAFSNPPLIS